MIIVNDIGNCEIDYLKVNLLICAQKTCFGRKSTLKWILSTIIRGSFASCLQALKKMRQ